MYKDEMWYRNWSRAVETHKEDLTDKQWKKFHIPFMLKIGKRAKDFADSCKTCRDYQHPLTRLAEEMRELPDSKAQRQYQTKLLGTITDHMVKEHRIAPPNYHMLKMLKYGVMAGSIIGVFVAIFVTGNPLHVPAGIILGVILAEIYGYGEDIRIKQEKRTL